MVEKRSWFIVPTYPKTDYINAYICENGHQLHERLKETGPDSAACPDCGAKILTNCPHCNAEMMVTRTIMRSTDGKTELIIVNSYCNKCGEPYPWTKRSLDCVGYVLHDDSFLTEQQKQEVLCVLPDVLDKNGGPSTNKAIVVIRKAMSIAGKETVSTVTSFVLKHGSAYALELFHKFFRP
jgi:hypothetical protein